ncbi:TECR family protein [Megaselia abdita]
MDIEIYNAKNSKPYGKCHVTENTTVSDLKFAIHKQIPQTPKAERLSIRLEARGKQVKDSETLKNLGVQSGGKIYIKDLGPQIGWKTVFLAEYAGPLIVYLWVYTRPYVFYGNLENAQPLGLTAHIAAACYTFHYAKRLLETIFVHRFSHSTMPLSNLFKNCSYYWGFTAYVSYHVNHPLFTSPCMCTVYAGLAGFLLCELGNFSIHMTLRNLRPAGSKVRKIPVPDANPLSKLFK